MASYSAVTKFSAQDKYSAVLGKMTNNTKKFAVSSSSSFKKVEQSALKMQKSIKRGFSKVFKDVVATAGVFAVGALLVTGVRGAINTFADFEQANANLSSVMATATQPQLKALQNDAVRLGSITAKTATEVVGLQESFARLGFEAPAIQNMTESTIAGSIAMNAELADTADLVGAVVRTFDDFTSADATSIIDQMTASTQQSALNFEKLQTALPNVAGAANAAGIPFNRLLALLGKLSDAGIDASSSSTALRNIFIESASQGLNYEQILTKIVNSQDKLTASNDEFGKRAAVSSTILAKNISQTAELSEGLLKTGVAQQAAAKKLDTLKGRLTLLGSAWEGFILLIEKGDGALGKFLKTSIEVVTDILSLASGTAKANDQLNGTEKRVRSIANRLIFFAKTLKAITTGILIYKGLMLAVKAFNFVMAINAIVTGKGAIALKGNVMALKAYGVITRTITALQWAWNAAMTANPIGLIVAAIAVAITSIVLLVKHWDTLKRKFEESPTWLKVALLPVLALSAPLLVLVNTIKKLTDNWEGLKNAFSSGGIVAGLKKLGGILVSAILDPLVMILNLLSKIPGIGGDFAIASDQIRAIQGFAEGGFGTDAQLAEPINTQQTQTETQRTLIQEQQQNVNININDPQERTEVDQGNGAVPILINNFAM